MREVGALVKKAELRTEQESRSALGFAVVTLLRDTKSTARVDVTPRLQE
jgi:hypothetical protein